MKHNKESICKNCNNKINASSTIDGKEDVMPRKGDYTICFSCNRISIFDEDLNIIPLSAEDLVELFEKDQEIYYNLINFSNFLKEFKKK